jgi:hypothetical protein
LGTRTELLVPQPLVELALLGFTLFAGGVVRADLKMALCSAPVVSRTSSRCNSAIRSLSAGSTG